MAHFSSIPCLALFGLLLSSTTNAINASCEPEQFSVLQVSGVAEHNASEWRLQWQDVEETLERLKQKLDEEWDGQHSQDPHPQRKALSLPDVWTFRFFESVFCSKVDKKQNEELAKKPAADQLEKIQSKAQAAKSTLTALNKAAPAIKNCIAAPAGKCDGSAVWNGVFQAVAELGPLVSAVSGTLGAVSPLLGLAGQLLSLLVGATPEKPPPPISLADMQAAVSQELRNFHLDQLGWDFMAMQEKIFELYRIWGGFAKSSDVTLLRTWYEKHLEREGGRVEGYTLEITKGYLALVGPASYRTNMAAKPAFNHGSCHKNQGPEYPQEACALETDQEKRKQCSKDMDTAVQEWGKLKTALEQFKALGNMLIGLNSIAEKILQSHPCSWVPASPASPSSKRFQIRLPWRKQKPKQEQKQEKNFCTVVDSIFAGYNRTTERTHKVIKNLKFLNGPSCEKNPKVSWALGQTSKSCTGFGACNWGYFVAVCGDKCSDRGMVELWRGMNDMDCSKVVKAQKTLWTQSPHVMKRSDRYDGKLSDKVRKTSRWGISVPTGMCDCPWRHSNLCAERNFCVEEPCLKYFTQNSLW